MTKSKKIITKNSTSFGKHSEAIVDDNLISLIEILQEIDIDKPIAKLNETSISNNNGGRIIL